MERPTSTAILGEASQRQRGQILAHPSTYDKVVTTVCSHHNSLSPRIAHEPVVHAVFFAPTRDADHVVDECSKSVYNPHGVVEDRTLNRNVSRISSSKRTASMPQAIGPRL